nr:hypothetical protein [Tanacetum cinerariifolium]
MRLSLLDEGARRFHSSSSSPPRKRRRASTCSSLSTTHSSSPVSSGPSRKRCRCPTADSSLIRADMLPPRKRLRDPSSTYCYEVSVDISTEMDIEDSIETGAEGDIERDTKSDIDSDILADIKAYIVVKAATTIKDDAAMDVVAVVKGVGDYEAEVDIESSSRGIVEIEVDVVTKSEVPDDIHVPIIAKSGSRETFDIGLDVVIQQLNGNGGGNGNGNGGGNGNCNRMNGGARGNAPVARVCTYKDFLNCQPCNFSGIERVVGLTVRIDEAYEMSCVTPPKYHSIMATRVM